MNAACRSGRIFVRWIVLLLALGAGTVVFAQGLEIEYGAPEQSVWTTRVTPEGVSDNPLRHWVGPLFARAGVNWRAATYPAARLFKYLQDGQTQFSILVRVPALESCCLYGRTPVAVAEIRAYHRPGTPPAGQREDLAGRSVIVLHGYSYGGLRRFLEDPAQRVTIHAARTHHAAMAMLASGRADYLVDYAGPVAEVLAEQPLPGVQSTILARQEVFFVLSKTLPDAEELMRRLEEIAATLPPPVPAAAPLPR